MALKELVKKTGRWLLGLAGGISILFVVLSFTDLPYYAYHRLGVSADTLESPPRVIVVLGGGGMPSPDGLIRCYYAAEAALTYPQAGVVIALPANEDGSRRQLDMMAHELILKGVDSLRISYESDGFNTRSQAVNIAEVYRAAGVRMPLLVVTSPEHLYRAVRVFEKVGFDAGGLPAFEKPVDEKKARDTDRSGDKRVRSVSLRYNMWSYMIYELLVLREYFAIAYYKLKGWI